MKLENYISSCRNPRIIENKKGDLMKVQCGKCPDCMHRKSKHYETLINEEAKNHRFCYFITLTYDEEFVPRACVVPNHHGRITYVDVTRRPYKSRPYANTFKHYRQEIASIDESYNSEDFNEFYQRLDIKPKYYDKKKYKNIRYIYKPDAQNFIKRLRNNIAKHSSESPRYYLTSEYGPDTFRPHFHLLLFFSDWRVTRILRECIRKAWKFGIADIQLADTNKSLYSYISSYTTSFVQLPRFLRHPSIAPFSLHSQRFGMQAIKVFRDYLYRHPGAAYEQVSMSHDATVSTYYPTATTQTLLYPRCFDYDRQTHTNLLQLYSCYYFLRKKCNSSCVSDLVKYILVNYDRDDYLRNLLSCLKCTDNETIKTHPQDRRYTPVLYLQQSSYYADFFVWSTLSLDRGEYYKGVLIDEVLQLYSRIYCAVNMSKHFLSFCCQMDFDKPFDYRKLTATISIIQYHYERKPLYSLRQQYKMQEAYIQEFNTDDVDIFYPIVEGTTAERLTESYRELYNNSTPILIINQSKDIFYKEHVKHKELNDRNGIFL